MTAKRFTIDVETENYENAYFENDKFLCYEDDYDAILNRLNELAEENEQLKTFREQNIQEYNKLKKVCNDCKLENEQLKERIKELQKESYGNLDGLNYYQEENASLSEKISNLEYDLDYFRAKSGSLEEGLFQNDREIAKLEKENKELKKRDELVSSYLQYEGSITLEKYDEIVDSLYKEWKKKRDLND